MKKKLYFIITFICIFIGIKGINAFSINASSSVYVGSNVAVTIEANGLVGRFDITSSNGSVLAGTYSNWIEDSTITVYFTANSTGVATITVKAVDVSDNSGNEVTGSRSTTINVVERQTRPQIDVNKTYSSNNNLESLSISGYELSPSFDKDTLEYTVELTPGLEKINISAEVESSSASVKGSGEVEVTDGMNTIEIVVTAENGNEKTYIIKANMEEKDPIKVKIDSNEYTVVKKRELINLIDGYEETTVKINEFDIPAIHNNITNVTLIGLKDSDGKIKLFAYDTKTGKYSNYLELSFNMINLLILEDNNTKYKKKTIKINGYDVPAYIYDGVDDYYLLYATNTMTGNTGYYLYDTVENSVQRYDINLINNASNVKSKYISLILVLSVVCFLTMLFLLIQSNKNKKNEG